MSKKFKKSLHHALKSAARAAKRAARAATMWVYRQGLRCDGGSLFINSFWRLLQSCHWRRPLPLLILLGLFMVPVVLVGVHQGTGITAGDYSTIAAAMLGLSRISKFLYRTSEAKAAIGCGTSKLYSLINSGVLEARRFGHRTYITGASLEAFVASLPRVVTPTMAKAEHDRWSGRANPRTGQQEDGAELGQRSRRDNPRSDLEEDVAE
jgi:hypothetical protein